MPGRLVILAGSLHAGLGGGDWDDASPNLCERRPEKLRRTPASLESRRKQTAEPKSYL